MLLNLVFLQNRENLDNKVEYLNAHLAHYTSQDDDSTTYRRLVTDRRQSGPRIARNIWPSVDFSIWEPQLHLRSLNHLQRNVPNFLLMSTTWAIYVAASKR